MTLRDTILQPWTWHTPRLDDEKNALWQRLEKKAAQFRKDGYTKGNRGRPSDLHIYKSESVCYEVSCPDNPG